MSGRDRDWPARLALDPTAFVAPGAVVVGEVTLGARSSVWFNTVVRGDSAAIVVGAGSNVQDGSVVHVDEGQPALIGARVTVGHRAIVHGCVIEDDCLIGMGAIVLSGARVGTGSLVGAGALIREGQQIPPGSLAVGSPARVIGPTADAHREAIRNGASHYAALAESYLRRGFARPHPMPDRDTGITPRERGPLTMLEWARLVGTLAEGPDWAAERLARTGPERWRTPPPGGGWAAVETLCHLRDVEAEVNLPRLEVILREEEPRIEAVDPPPWAEARGYRASDPAAALAAWRASRERFVAAIAPLRAAEWRRLGWHSLRGPFPLGEMVRDCVEHELGHRRQIAVALGERP